MRKWILMLVCVLTLSALSVCFAEDSDNSGEVTAQQSYVNEAITVASETSADASLQPPVLRDVAYMTQGGRQLIMQSLITRVDIFPNPVTAKKFRKLFVCQGVLLVYIA